ncbi:tonB-system energizer ExbB [Kaistia nematophila]|uniref:Biopolymer transport protein ExbB n=1 Tax=Kaistia nematophila TaxID=2994654 RepID=A0A9X3EER1_9HYPH|nr:tonB-system energizer ExbB [Kaistia nematophila]MCX5571810.1 tonB-system energizer ExbB [Kaistia nematophila]
MLANLCRGAALAVAIVGLSIPVGSTMAFGQAAEAPAVTAPAAEPAPAPAPTAAPEPVLQDPVELPAGEHGVDRSTLPHDLSPIGMFTNADMVVKGVIGILAVASIITWAIFLSKTLELAALRHRTRARGERVARSRTLAEAEAQVGRRNDPASRLVQAAVEEVSLSSGLSAEGIKERVASRFERIESRAGREMIRGTAVLATVGSLSPFIGLFGTVWGIMNSFIGISQANTTNLAVVAPGIAEALFATAIGLVAAIPAVLFYNVFARTIAGNKAVIADVAAETMRLVSRDLDRADARGPSRLAAAE